MIDYYLETKMPRRRPFFLPRLDRLPKVRRRGASAVEFSIVAPIFFLAIFGAIEFSRVSMLRNLAQDASYEAARTCMVDGASTSDAMNSANEILGLLGTRGAVVTINGGAGLSEASQSIRVSIDIPLSQNSLVMPLLFSSKHILATTELKTERYDGYFDSQ